MDPFKQQFNSGNFQPHFFHEKAKETRIINESSYIQVLYPDGSEKIFKRLDLASCELIVQRKTGTDEWIKQKETTKGNKRLSIDTHIRLAGFSKVKPITAEEIAIACFTSLL